jgi:hypothetical protein
MNAMLEPRMVAASIHGLDASPHGDSLSPNRNTASSQGALIEKYGRSIHRTLSPKIDLAGEWLA